MSFVRIVVYIGVVAGIISGWECVRGDFYSAVKSIDNENDQKLKEKSSEEEVDLFNNDDNNNDDEEDKNDQINEEKDEKLSNLSFEKGFEYVAKKAKYSVVNVATMLVIEESNAGISDFFKGGPFDDLLKDFFDIPQNKKKTRKTNALGSGFIVKIDKEKQKAFIVTNNHVVEKAKKVVIFLHDKTEIPAEVHATDQRTDIAILSIDLKDLGKKTKKIKAIKWGDSNDINEGNFVVAIGNPFGFGSTVTHGIVSSKGRNISGVKSSLSLVDDFIQHSAPINMGNSGGCLLNVYGKVIGINNAIFSTSGGNIGIGFAIPSNTAKITCNQLIEHKRTFRGWLGAEVHQVNTKQAESVGLTEHTLDSSKVFGAFIARLVPDGPAEKAGVKVGDIIIEFNGKKITEKCSLQSATGSTEIGKKVPVKVWRQKDNDNKWGEVVLELTVGDFEEAIKSGAIDSKNKDKSNRSSSSKEEDIDSLGITVSNLPKEYIDKYPKEVKVIVTKVDDSKINSFYGSIFAVGDGIISANNKKINDAGQLKSIIEEASKNTNNKRKPIPFVVIRNGSMMMLATTIEIEEKNKVEDNKKKSNIEINEKNKEESNNNKIEDNKEKDKISKNSKNKT